MLVQSNPCVSLENVIGLDIECRARHSSSSLVYESRKGLVVLPGVVRNHNMETLGEVGPVTVQHCGRNEWEPMIGVSKGVHMINSATNARIEM